MAPASTMSPRIARSVPADVGGSSISLQVILTVVAASTVVFGLSSYLIIERQRRALIEQVDQHAFMVSETIKAATRYDMMGNHHEHVHQVVNNVAGQQEVDLVRIFNKRGLLVYGFYASLKDLTVDRQARACQACHLNEPPLRELPRAQMTRVFEHPEAGRQLGIVNPIYNEPSCWQAACHAHPEEASVLGVLEVSLGLDEVDRRLAASGRSAAGLSGAAILAIVLILWLFFNRRVARPVEQLLEATNRVASGDLEHRLRAGRNDELGQLRRSFNEMTRRLATARSQVYQSDKLASIGRLAAGVAHEINNPLTGVLVHSSTLQRKAEAGSEERENLETIVHETKRCREIVKGLLDFSRQGRLRRAQVDINQVVEQAVKIVENELSVKNVELVQDLVVGLPAVSADRNQLVQVLVNLLVNAADAMDRGGGRVRIETGLAETERDEAIEVVVTDDGRGIPEENLDRIFEPFFTTKEASGTGLGLAVVWGMIEEHGGKIEISSNVGVGTRVRVLLPLVQASAGDLTEEVVSHA